MAITRLPTGAVTGFFVPGVFSNRVIDAVKSNLVAWDSIDSSWESELTKGYVLYIPKMNTITATEIITGTLKATLDPFVTAGVTLTIDHYYDAPVDIGYASMKQQGANMEDAAVTECAYAISKVIDTHVCTFFDDLGSFSTTAYGSDGQTLTDDILLYCKQVLDEADVPMDGDRSLILDPAALVDMLKIDKFVAAQYVNIGAVTNGIVGKSPIYGCTVKVTNNLTVSAGTVGNVAVMLHKKAIAAAAQIENAWTKEFPELHLRRYDCDALWGVTEENDTFGVPFYTRHA